jgi:hypothetical protein
VTETRGLLEAAPTVQVIVRMPAELHEQIKAAAARNERTMSAQVRHWCRSALVVRDGMNTEQDAP